MKPNVLNKIFPTSKDSSSKYENRLRDFEVRNQSYSISAFRISEGKVTKRTCKCSQCKCKHHKHKALVKILPGAFASDLLY